MNLEGYLDRIQFSGTPSEDLATLKQIHHQHLLHIPYENVDVQLGTPLDFDRERIYDKLVTRQRGGWCYEMNGLMSWALQEIGFSVARMSGGVMRETDGDGQMGNHLVLEVNLAGQKWLADVGLGDGARYPIPIQPDTHEQGGLTYGLKRLDDGYWRFENQHLSNVRSFDFKHEIASENQLEQKCHWLQTDPQSPFKQVLIVQRFTADTIEVQLGKRHTTITAHGKTSTDLETIEDMHHHLARVFGLDVDLTPIWSEIVAKHEQIFAPPENV